MCFFNFLSNIGKANQHQEEDNICNNLIVGLKARDWDKVRHAQNLASCKLEKKIATWLYLLESDKPSSLNEYITFCDTHSHPLYTSPVRAKLEAQVNEASLDRHVLNFFAKNPPKTARVTALYAKRLYALGDKEKSILVIRKAWQDGLGSSLQEQEDFGFFRKHFGSTDHKKRIENLLLSKNIESARQLIIHLSPSERKFYYALVALISFDAEANALVKSLPAGVHKNPIFAFSYLRWLNKCSPEKALTYFRKIHALINEHPALFWKEHYILSRDLLAQKKPDKAYDILRGHPYTEKGVLTEIEWFLGWLSLAHLNKPSQALKHFKRLEVNVSTPISQARAWYWLGRAFEHLKKLPTANEWYSKASQLTTTYYGQLASDKIGCSLVPPLQPLSESHQDKERFEQQEFVRVIQVLKETDSLDRALPFMLHLIDTAHTKDEILKTLTFAKKISPFFLITSARRKTNYGIFFHPEFYPLLPPEERSLITNISPALIHALIRRESEFNQRAISIAGAHGLMQVMPATAKSLTTRLNIAYNKERLLTDRLYNIRLGIACINECYRQFNGDVVLALAAYNASPQAVEKWLLLYGDPRKSAITYTDWVESIPYSETRTYVQRVLENFRIYELILPTLNVQ